MHVLITGVTGTAGSAALRAALADAGVARVTAVARRPLDVADPKLAVLVLGDFLDWTPVAQQLASVDAVLWCLGVSQTEVTRSQLHVVTYDITLAGARAVLAANPSVAFCFLSGSGADPTGRARMPFAQEKGMAEAALDGLGFTRLWHFRPGYIHPSVRDARSRPLALRLGAVAGRVLRVVAPQATVDSDMLARAMLRVAQHGDAHHILDNRAIRRLAQG